MLSLSSWWNRSSSKEDAMITRRNLFKAAGAGGILVGSGLVFPRLFTSEAEAQAALNLSPMLSEGTRAEAVLDALRGKQPLIKLSYRPPNYETSIEHFQTAITPNDVFLRALPFDRRSGLFDRRLAILRGVRRVGAECRDHFSMPAGSTLAKQAGEIHQLPIEVPHSRDGGLAATGFAGAHPYEI